MSSRQIAVERTTPRVWAVPWVLLSYVVIGLAALLPRVLDLGAWLSGDEASFWLHRSEVFLEAIRTGDYAATAITDHPGVTTMWLGSAGLMLNSVLSSWGLLHDFSFPAFLAIMRLPTALTHVAGVLVGYALLRRLFVPNAAALAALLWALDPFVIAFSRVLHVDALPATFITVSLLAACLYWYNERWHRWLILSAIAGGLAVLSKSPSLALLPAVGMMAFLAAQHTDDGRWTMDDGTASIVHRLSSIVLPLVAWGVICALTVFVLWPALWVGPLQAYRQVRIGIEAEGASPHMLGNFFMGQEDDAPGPLFYPVALALRLTPWAMIGLLALPFVWRRTRDLERRDLAALAGFAIIFIAAMSIFPKKFNRYLMPMFPAVDILAAYGLLGVLDLGFGIWDLGRSHSKIQNLKSKIGILWVSVIALAGALNAAYWHPYDIAAFNQLLGGANAGARTFLIGWGEGLNEAADWLNQQPDITGVRVAATMTTGLQSYLRQGAQSVIPDGSDLPPATGYVVVYVRQVQWGQPWAPFDRFYGREPPLHVVRIHGVDYAWIYQVPPPVAQPRESSFGPAIHLHGYTLVGAPQRGQPLRLTLAWKTLAAPGSDYMLFAHLIGADGERYAQADLPYQTSTWAADRYQKTELAVPLPADIPAGKYRVVIGLYDPNDGRRLPVSASEPIDSALDGPDALPLAEILLN